MIWHSTEVVDQGHQGLVRLQLHRHVPLDSPRERSDQPVRWAEHHVRVSACRYAWRYTVRVTLGRFVLRPILVDRAVIRSLGRRRYDSVRHRAHCTSRPCH